MSNLTDIDDEARVLTPAERMEKLCESIAALAAANARREKFASNLLAHEAPDPCTEGERGTYAEILQESLTHLGEVLARTMALHADGTFDRCIDILQIETIGRP